MSTKSLALFVLTAASIGLGGLAQAADLQAGEAKVKQICQACHGLDGNTPIPGNPTLGGQYPDYLAKAMRDYKNGSRKNAMMGGMVASLSDQDIENVSAYYAAQPAVVYTKH